MKKFKKGDEVIFHRIGWVDEVSDSRREFLYKKLTINKYDHEVRGFPSYTTEEIKGYIVCEDEIEFAAIYGSPLYKALE